MTEPGFGSRLRDHPDAFRLAVANIIDGLGTYVGLAALLVVGYHSTRLLGTAMVLAAHVLPGLLVTLFVAPRLQHRQRRTVLLVLNLVGVLALLPAIAAPGAETAILAAALLGASGVATRGVQMAALAEAVPAEVRGRFYGMVGSFTQAVQVIGLASGGAIAAALSARTALAIDALSFTVAGLVIATIHFARVSPVRTAPAPRSFFGSAPHVVWSIPLLRMLAFVTCIGALVASVPEAASPAVTSTKLLPLVMAASPAGGAVAALICTRLGVFGRVRDTLRLALVSSVSLVVLGAGMYVAFQQPADSVVRALYGIAANALIGGLGVWFLGMIAAFTEYTPASEMVAVGSFMSWSVGAASGLGGFAVALLGVAGGYAALGLMLLPAAAWGLRMVLSLDLSSSPGTVDPHAA
ncbi:MFS transporter [Nostocoides sp. HKS02]|uniref:MFS transporter n=1 Tax=Nostocoides sp. HKS02 TaxID=1813880 RepID=UPI0012B4ED03|nr:MFS transporter [Tetrasphaera sp. HKS02]QGN58406.1 MFS transporter [Tetrasphaera sp. HKS02]